MNNDVFDRLHDMLIDEALSAADELPDKNIPEEAPVEFPEEFEKRMDKLFGDERRRARRTHPRRYAKRIIILAAAFTAAAAATVMSVEALRVRFLNTFILPLKTNTEIRFSDGGDMPKSFDADVKFGYIPDGFNVTQADRNSQGVFFKLDNGDKYFSISVYLYSENAVAGIDTENAKTENIDINGNTALYSEKPEVQILFWVDGTYMYMMDGNIGRDELVQIAQNLKVY